MSGISEFCESMAANGLRCLDGIVPDGKIHRFHVDGDKAGSKNGWYILFGDDGLPAGSYGSWKTGETFSSSSKERKTLTEAERARWRERNAKAKKARDQELRRLHAEARKKAVRIWENAKPVTEHPYLEAKGVSSHGLRQSEDSLVIPVRDTDGVIHTLQFINSTGRKRFLSNGAIRGHFFRIDGDGAIVLVCEGYATGASLHGTTGYPVIIAFNAGNLKPVCEALCKKSPDTKFIVCADDDFETAGNPGLTKAKEAAAIGAALAIPKFKDQAHRGTDFNDLHQAEGLEAVKRLVEEALNGHQDKSPDVAQKTAEHLASLSRFEYDQQRISMAEKLGVRVSTLDQEVEKMRKANNPDSTKSLIEELEPWPEPVTGTEVLSIINQIIKNYVVIQDESATVCTLWTVLSYAYNNFVCLPILAVQSPVKRCGKSRLMTGVLSALCYRVLSASNVTGPVVFRTIEKYHPCLVLDECDTYMPENECLRGVINSGHTRQTAFVLRCNPNTLEPEQFNTWCPKIIGGIGRLPDTLQDRSVVINLKRKLATEKTKRLTLNFNDECLDLRRKCLRWSSDNADKLKRSDPQMPTIDNDRALDNWLPLLAIADLAGGSWPKKARNAMVEIEAAKEDDSARIMLLQDIQKIFNERKCKNLWTQTLIDALVAMEDRPWSEWKRGKPLTGASLSRLLKSFEIKPGEIRQGDKNKRGYEFKEFNDVFKRYVSLPPPNQSATTLQASIHESFEEKQNATKGMDVAPLNRSKLASIADCSTIALQKRDLGGEGIKAPYSITKSEQEVVEIW